MSFLQRFNQNSVGRSKNQIKEPNLGLKYLKRCNCIDQNFKICNCFGNAKNEQDISN